MEKFGVPEPQWMLDRLESGPMYWRRQSANAGNNPRYVSRISGISYMACSRRVWFNLKGLVRGGILGLKGSESFPSTMQECAYRGQQNVTKYIYGVVHGIGNTAGHQSVLIYFRP